MARFEQRDITRTGSHGSSTARPVPVVQRQPSRLDRFVGWLSRHWLPTILTILGIYVGLPWLAPIFMRVGWTGAGRVIYAVYATQCHQLPQRSFFLFGPKPMYSLAEIQRAFQPTDNPLILRQFIGNVEMGWKVAWSDRMVTMYGSMFVFGLIYAVLRRRMKPISWWLLVVLALPMALDGATHMLSDLSGIGQGFRDTNAWLAALTGNALSTTFYAGDALGSFNSWMRLITGTLFGLGAIWFGFPQLDRMFGMVMRESAPVYSRK